MSNTKIRVGMLVRHGETIGKVVNVSEDGQQVTVLRDGDKPWFMVSDIVPRDVVTVLDPPDMVNHPPHYTSSDARCLGCGRPIECVDVNEHMPANLAAAMKYVWRCDDKYDDPAEDLSKAIWYLQREIERRARLRARKKASKEDRC